MAIIVSLNVSLPFQVLDTAKRSTMLGMGDLHLDKVYSSGWSLSGHPTRYIDAGIYAIWSHMRPATLLASSDMISSMLAIPIPAWRSWVA